MILRSTEAKTTHTPANSNGSKVPFFAPVVQPKLKVNTPGDKYEVEADRIADKVVNHYDSTTPVWTSTKPTTAVQRLCDNCQDESTQQPDFETSEENTQSTGPSSVMRKCATCEAEMEQQENTVQLKCATCEAKAPEDIIQRDWLGSDPKEECEACQKDKEVQTKRINLPTEGNKAVPAEVIKVLDGQSGYPLSSDIRQYMEQRLGADLSRVRIVRGMDAAQSALKVNARAYTYGHKIVFGEGEFSPETTQGKLLLAHELTHVLQQGGATIKRKEDAPTPQQAAAASTEAVCQQLVPATDAPGAVPPVASETNAEGPTVPDKTPDPNPKPTTKGILDQNAAPVPEVPGTAEKESAKLKKSDIKDPAFDDFKSDLGKKAEKQSKHEDPVQKAADAQQSSDVGDKSAEMQKGAQVLTTQENVENKPTPPFSAATFKSKLRAKIAEQFPNDKGGYNAFKKDPQAIENLKGQPVSDIKAAKSQSVSQVEQIDNPANVSEVQQQSLVTHEVQPLVPEAIGKKSHLGDAARAVPKPQEPEAFQIPEEHNAESLDREMAKNNMTDKQLADSEEPSFLDTLETKRQTQAKLCALPDQMKSQEATMIQTSTQKAQQKSASAMTTMQETRANQFGLAEDNQESLKKEDEARLNTYFSTIQTIYSETETAVNVKLECLDCEVGLIFQQAVDESFSTFKENVSERLDDYYGADLLFVTVSNEDKEADDGTAYLNRMLDEKIRPLEVKLQNLTPQDPERKSLERQIARLKAQKGELIIDRIFKEEKEQFMSGLDTALDTIATRVETQLNQAKALVQDGKNRIEAEKTKLPTDLQTKAEEKTAFIMDNMKGLEDTINEKEQDLVNSLAKQYADNVNKLAEEFEKIRADEAMPLWKRAWEKIKAIALIIYNLGQTLWRVAQKAAAVIGDILAHPIRFFGNLIDAISLGFSNFKKNITTHLQNIAFKLVMKVVPPGLAFPKEWDAKGTFGFLLGVFGLTKENLRFQLVDRLGEPIVERLEQDFELLQIVQKEGIGGLWSRLMDKIGDVKDQLLNAAVSYFKQQIIEKAVIFLLSALNPVTGFLKVCKSIIDLVTFFLKNLANILRLFESIIDSFADMVAGRINSAAIRIENAFADLLLIGIKFLAALIGVNLDAIQEKIGKILDKFKNPVNRAIKWVVDQAAAFAKRTGLTKAAKAVKGKVDQGKEWAKGKVEQGKGVVKNVAGKFFEFFGVKSYFKDEKGNNHAVYFEDVEGTPVMVVRSTPKSIEEFLDYYRENHQDDLKDETKKDHYDSLIELASKLKKEIIALNRKKGTKDEKPQQRKLLDIKTQISHKLGLMMADNRNVGTSFESYLLEGSVGQYSKLPNSVYDIMEGDHQPQTALLKWARKYLKPSLIDDWIGSGHGRNAYAILLHKRRHKLGATHSSAPDTLDTDQQIAQESDTKKKRKIVLKKLKDELVHDADTMLDVYKKPYSHEDTWGDIHHETEGTDSEKKELVSKIKANVKVGEENIKHQPLDNLTQ